MDARSGLGAGWFSFLNSMSTIHKGSNWRNTVYVNGVATDTAGLVSAASSASYTSAPWIHLHISADTTFDDDITLLARYTSEEVLPGKIYSVHLWPSELSAADVYNTMHGMPASVTPVASYSATDLDAYRSGSSGDEVYTYPLPPARPIPGPRSGVYAALAKPGGRIHRPWA